MAVIFSASSDQESAQHSSRIIGPIVHWLFPRMPEDQVEEIIFLARKCAHLTEYAILGWLIWRVFRKPSRNDLRPWVWREAARALFLVLVYAASDEFHQLYVPSRQASIVDVLIDTAGGAAGLLFVWALGRVRKRW